MHSVPEVREIWKCSLSAEVLRRFGELRLRLTGTSMLPTLWPDDLLALEPVQLGQVFPGDVVLYRRENRFVLHRVLKFEQQAGQATAITRGDAVPHPDEPITPEELLGRVTMGFRCGRAFVPARRLNWLERCLGLMLFHCDRLCDVMLRLRTWRSTYLQLCLDDASGEEWSAPGLEV